MIQEDLITLAKKAAPQADQIQTSSISNSDDFSHWVVRLTYNNGSFLLVEGSHNRVQQIRGPLNRHPTPWAKRAEPGLRPRFLTPEEQEVAEIIYHYNGPEAMEEYIALRLNPSV